MATTPARMQQRRRTATQWNTENPVLADGEIGYIRNTSPPQFKIGDGTTAWTSLAAQSELVADDPSEVDLTTAGGFTTLTLLDPIARTPLHRISQYYLNYVNALGATFSMTQDRLILQPVMLSKGVVDRIGVEVTTAVASLVCRLGIYTDDSGLPNALVAEATSTADCSTIGTKDLTISATIGQNGRYWLAGVTQAAAGGGLRAPTSAPPQMIPLPLGTTAPNGNLSYASRRQDSVTGALPSTVTVINTPQSANFCVHYRYSSVG